MALEIVGILAAVLSVAVPGLLAGWVLFRGTEFSPFDRGVLSLLLGVLGVPSLTFVEFMLLSLRFSAGLVLVNALLISLVSLFLLHRDKQLKAPEWIHRVRSFKLDVPFVWRKHLPLILFVLMVVTFYVRIASSWNPYFFEFDPFYYERVTETLVKTGDIPALSYVAYYPAGQNLRGYPLVQYMAGGWYSVYQAVAGLAYDKETLVRVQQLYPPLVGLFMTFLAYFLTREHFGDYPALFSAALFAFTPQLIKKMAASEAALWPFGAMSAVMAVALTAVALNRKSLRLGLLAGFALFTTTVGSALALWPFGVIALYLVLFSLIEFLHGRLDAQTVKITAAITLGGAAGDALVRLFQWGRFIEVPLGSLLLVGALVPMVLLFLAQRHKVDRRLALGGLVFVLLLFLATPLGAPVLGFVRSALGLAGAFGPLTLTIAEENPTTPNFWPDAFAALSPAVVLPLVALLLALEAAVYAARDKRWWLVGLLGFLTLVALFLSSAAISALSGLVAALGVSSAFLASATAKDVFVYTFLAAVSALALYKESPSHHLLLLFVLFIFPIAYIGLNKLKWLFHLSVALALAAPLIAGQLSKVADALNTWLKLADAKSVRNAALALVVLIALGVSAVQASTVPRSMQELSFSSISPDWLATTQWMRANLAGTDARILSWWDYGHWIDFLGGTNTVIDPGNVYPQYNQEAAKSFVDGNLSDLYYTLEYHKATHVLVDSQLISKWGALVYLSGTCTRVQSPICPDPAYIPQWQQGVGKSTYETEHYFELLQATGQNCPPTLAPVPLPALKSNFGATYCATDTDLFLATREGLDERFKRPFKLTNNAATIPSIDKNVSYLFPVQQGVFLNANPLLSYANLESKVYKSAFARLYLFERLPGFELVYRSPTNEVKIFRYTGRASREDIRAAGLDA